MSDAHATIKSEIEGLDKDEVFRVTCDNYRQVLPWAEDYDVIVNVEPHGPYTTDAIQTGNTASVVYTTRAPVKADLKTGINVIADRPQNGADMRTDSLSYRRTPSATWDAVWPTGAAQAEFRPVAPRCDAGTDCDETFWIFWEGAGDITITRLGGVGVVLETLEEVISCLFGLAPLLPLRLLPAFFRPLLLHRRPAECGVV